MKYLHTIAFNLMAMAVGYKGFIEDIFYEYKDDKDLSFNIYCGDRSNMDMIYDMLYKISDNETKFKVSSDATTSGHFIVTIELPSLEDKNDFVTALRLQLFNPNGG